MLVAADWLVIAGLGSIWLGGLIVWVAPLPRHLRRGARPTAPAGSAAAFGLFWLDQYGYIGLTLLGLGLLSLLFGLLR